MNPINEHNNNASLFSVLFGLLTLLSVAWVVFFFNYHWPTVVTGPFREQHIPAYFFWLGEVIGLATALTALRLITLRRANKTGISKSIYSAAWIVLVVIGVIFLLVAADRYLNSASLITF